MNIKVFDLTAHIRQQAADDRTALQKKQEADRIDNEMKRVERLMEQGNGFMAALLQDGYTQAAARVNRILRDMDEEHSYLSEQWNSLVRVPL